MLLQIAGRQQTNHRPVLESARANRQAYKKRAEGNSPTAVMCTAFIIAGTIYKFNTQFNIFTHQSLQTCSKSAHFLYFYLQHLTTSLNVS
jgi:hypothetical protein